MNLNLWQQRLDAARARAERAEADAAALRAALKAAWPLIAARGNQHGGDLVERARAALADDAGSALLSELAAARAVIKAIRAGIARDGYCPICGGEHAEGCPLVAYDAATKEGGNE